MNKQLKEALRNLKQQQIFSNKYDEHFHLSTHELTRESFWKEQSKLIDWFKEPTTILDRSHAPFYKWFKGGILNTSYNCIDRHAHQTPSAEAILHESPLTNYSRSYNYQEVLDLVSRLAGALQAHGIQKGDRVIVYMPIIPEAIFAMLAVIRIGAIHSVVFGGFGAHELGFRIKNCKAKMVISASCGIEPKGVINYKSIVDEAIEYSGIQGIKKIILQRDTMKSALKKGQDFDFYDELSKAKPVQPIPMDANEYLYLLYTSGTTGNPNGLLREIGGQAVALAYSAKYVLEMQKGDTYFSTADLGWAIGHSYVVYEPLLTGCRTVVYEGKPVATPDPGQYWKLCEKYKVKTMFTSPTAIRMLRKVDPEGEWIQKFDLTSLRAVLAGGEKLDVSSFNWLLSRLPKTSVLIDFYGQTETGRGIGHNFMPSLNTFPYKLGSCGKPNIGHNIKILDDSGIEVEKGTIGNLCIKLPMPPSLAANIYGDSDDNSSFAKKYFSQFQGYYCTGDAGYMDEDGYLYVTSRVDDIIKTAGHRLCTSAIEESLIALPNILEAAVVAVKDEIRGEIPVGFVVLKGKSEKFDKKKIENECITKVRQDIGPVAAFQKCIIVESLPKTRSGKIIRQILKALINGETPKIPSTIEDINVIGKIKKAIETF